MRRWKVESKNLAEVGYDPVFKTLDVVFVNAPHLVYTYERVGMIKFVKLMTAESVGGYFDWAIRSRPRLHPYTKRRVK